MTLSFTRTLWSLRHLVMIVLLILIALIVTTLPVHAATYNVGCTAGVGDTAQFVASINAANGDAAADTINLAANCVYTLVADLPIITTSMTINGGSGTIIDGADAYRPFYITGGDVSINDLTVRHGYAPVISGQATASAVLMATDQPSPGSVTINRSNFIDNGPSPAIWNTSFVLTILNSSFDGNGWDVPNPGFLAPNAIRVFVGTLSLINSTVTNHTSTRGVAVQTTTTDSVLISNSTIAGNYGGFYAQGGTMVVRNSILANNVGDDDCQAIGAAATVTNSVVMTQGTFFPCGVTNGVNGNTTADPKLKPLTGNPAYLPIASDSPAYNTGNNSDIYPGLTTDQAGNTRVRDGTVDMGAFETQAPAVSFDANSTTADEGASGTLTLRRYGGTTIGSQTVNLTLTRGANLTAGDYTISGGSISGQVGNVTVTIPSGSATVDLTFTAINDGFSAEPDNALTVAIAPDPFYDIGFINSAVAIIPQNGLVVSTMTDNTTDEGTLRQAILNANSFVTNDTISFTTSGTIGLTSLLPDIAANGRIIINGGNAIAISGGFARRVFNVPAGSDLRLRDMTVQWGFATTDGGAIHNAGLLQLIGVTVQSSDSFGNGGGIKNDLGATMTLINSTITNSSAVSGGGIANSGTAFISNSTIADNSATTSGAGLFTTGTVTLDNSIIGANRTTGNCFGTVTAHFSLIQDGGCGIVNGVDGNRIGDPVFGALTGSPAYFPLLISSPAINAGSNALVSGAITTDQPGNNRIIDTTVDMGAFESTPASLNLTLAMQGRPAAPNPAYVIDVQVQIRRVGETLPLVILNLVSDANGVVTIPGMTAWNYDIRVKGSHTLARLSNLTLSAGANNLTSPLLLEGDANNNNSVLLADFSLLASAFATVVGDPGYNAQADFNNDGTIQLVDFSLLASNYTQSGVP